MTPAEKNQAAINEIRATLRGAGTLHPTQLRRKYHLGAALFSVLSKLQVLDKAGTRNGAKYSTGRYIDVIEGKDLIGLESLRSDETKCANLRRTLESRYLAAAGGGIIRKHLMLPNSANQATIDKYRRALDNLRSRLAKGLALINLHTFHKLYGINPAFIRVLTEVGALRAAPMHKTKGGPPRLGAESVLYEATDLLQFVNAEDVYNVDALKNTSRASRLKTVLQNRKEESNRPAPIAAPAVDADMPQNDETAKRTRVRKMEGMTIAQKYDAALVELRGFFKRSNTAKVHRHEFQTRHHLGSSTLTVLVRLGCLDLTDKRRAHPDGIRLRKTPLLDVVRGSDIASVESLRRSDSLRDELKATLIARLNGLDAPSQQDRTRKAFVSPNRSVSAAPEVAEASALEPTNVPLINDAPAQVDAVPLLKDRAKEAFFSGNDELATSLRDILRELGAI